MVTKRELRFVTSGPSLRSPSWQRGCEIRVPLNRASEPDKPCRLTSNRAPFSDFITANNRLKEMLRLAETISRLNDPVLITGETGVGKELLARAIHDASTRRGAFVALNVAGLEETVFDDTLFGHVKGAFTGADQARKGLAAAAEGGTLFLDEIGDLKPQSQVKLLRFLESGEFLPLGSDWPRRSSARFVAATNCDLRQRVDRGIFRKDLLYRLSTFHLIVPALRERTEDIPLMCDLLLRLLTPASESVPQVTPEAMHVLTSLSYPGNVRELRQILVRAKVASSDGVIDPATLSALGVQQSASESVAVIRFPEKLPTVRETVDALVYEAIRRAGGKQNAAAGLIGLSPQALNQRLRSLRAAPATASRSGTASRD